MGGTGQDKNEIMGSTKKKSGPLTGKRCLFKENIWLLWKAHVEYRKMRKVWQGPVAGPECHQESGCFLCTQWEALEVF